MEKIYKQLKTNKDINEDSYIKELDKLLKKGNNIDQIFSPSYIVYELGTILHLAIRSGYYKIVKFALEKKTDIAKAYKTRYYRQYNIVSGSWNSLEYAIIKYNSFQNIKYGNCFELLKNKFLATYSIH